MPASRPALHESRIASLPLVSRGKVRDNYAVGEDRLLIVTTDRLSAFELGASYRFTTKVRLYGAWYRFEFEDDDLSEATLSEVGNVFVLGLRLTL